MAKRGPKHKPAAVLRARGSKIVKDRGPEPEAPAGDPEMPDGMPEVAELLWPHLIGMVREMGLLSRADEFELGSYCVAYAFYWDAVRDLRENGRTYTTVGAGGSEMHRGNPAFGQMMECRKEMARIGSCYGLTPSARASLAAAVEPAAAQSKERFFRVVK